MKWWPMCCTFCRLRKPKIFYPLKDRRELIVFFCKFFLKVVWYYERLRYRKWKKNMFNMSCHDDNLLFCGRQPSCHFCLKVCEDKLAEETLLYIGACVCNLFTDSVSPEIYRNSAVPLLFYNFVPCLEMFVPWHCQKNWLVSFLLYHDLCCQG